MRGREMQGNTETDIAPADEPEECDEFGDHRFSHPRPSAHILAVLDPMSRSK